MSDTNDNTAKSRIRITLKNGYTEDMLSSITPDDLIRGLLNDGDIGKALGFNDVNGHWFMFNTQELVSISIEPVKS